MKDGRLRQEDGLSTRVSAQSTLAKTCGVYAELLSGILKDIERAITERNLSKVGLLCKAQFDGVPRVCGTSVDCKDVKVYTLYL